MRPLWLELLLTPMAAPETVHLRRLRRGWQASCLTLSVALSAFSWLPESGKRAASLVIAALIVAAVWQGRVYWRRKNRADDDHIARLAERAR